MSGAVSESDQDSGIYCGDSPSAVLGGMLRETTTTDWGEDAVKGGWAPPDSKETARMTEEERRRHSLKRELTTWWYTQAQKEVGLVIDKAIEYGAADLKVMGKAMECLMEKKNEEVRPERVGIELAIGFYALGKVARLFGAYERGELPSDDCWADLGIYCRMAQRVRESGGWPE